MTEKRCRCGRNGYTRPKDNHCKVCGGVRMVPSGQPRSRASVLTKVQRGPFNHPDRDITRPEHRDGPVIVRQA